MNTTQVGGIHKTVFKAEIVQKRPLHISSEVLCVCCSQLLCQLDACQARNAALKGIARHVEFLHFLLSKQTHSNVNLFPAAKDPTLRKAERVGAQCLPEGLLPSLPGRAGAGGTCWGCCLAPVCHWDIKRPATKALPSFKVQCCDLGKKKKRTAAFLCRGR